MPLLTEIYYKQYFIFEHLKVHYNTLYTLNLTGMVWIDHEKLRQS